MGEGASIQEISEQILYYHRDPKWSTSDSTIGPPTPRTKHSWTEEAVQFLGLSSALYTLPSSLGIGDLVEERTKQIFFGKSTLVFVALESSAEILAVVQVSRLYQNGSKSDNAGGNPLAVRASVERCHSLFCLLRGGGICTRLGPSTKLMGELYRLLKKIRQEKDQYLKSSTKSNENDDDKFNEKIAKLQGEVKAMRMRLPIQSIRRDLDAHYKEYLAYQGLAMARNGGTGRCLVETIPEPIVCSNGRRATHCLWPMMSDDTSISLATRKLLDDSTQSSGDTISLIGISTFYYGQLAHVHWSEVSIVSKLDERTNISGSITTNNDQLHGVMHYMASYCARMSQLQSSKHDLNSSHCQLGIKNIALSFGESSSGHSSAKNENSASTPSIHGRFFPPPPQFMLNTIEEPSFIQISCNQQAWALKVHLTAHICCEEFTKDIPYAMHTVAFQVEEYIFLLFFDARCQSGASETLLGLASKLKELVLRAETDAQGEDSRQRNDVAMELTTEPGQDVIIVNRELNKLYLYSDRKSPIQKDKKKSSGPPRRIFGFMNKSHSNSGDSDRVNNQAIQLEWTNLGLDSRHLLASHLHLDTILAFDDMMNEIARRRRSAATQGRDSIDMVELCTCMPLGWIYAFATGKMELYAFFDSSIYVTVADVQSAASKIQEQFFEQDKV